MDARIEAEVAVISLAVGPMVTVVTTIVVDDLAIELVSLFDHASILAPFLALSGTSRNAVAPDPFHEREVDAWAFVA